MLSVACTDIVTCAPWAGVILTLLTAHIMFPDCYKCDKLLIGKTLTLITWHPGFCNHRPSSGPDQIPAKYGSSGWKLCHRSASVSDENWVKSPARLCLFCAILLQNCSWKIFKIFGDETFVGDVFATSGSFIVTVWREATNHLIDNISLSNDPNSCC